MFNVGRSQQPVAPVARQPVVVQQGQKQKVTAPAQAQLQAIADDRWKRLAAGAYPWFERQILPITDGERQELASRWSWLWKSSDDLNEIRFRQHWHEGEQALRADLRAPDRATDAAYESFRTALKFAATSGLKMACETRLGQSFAVKHVPTAVLAERLRTGDREGLKAELETMQNVINHALDAAQTTRRYFTDILAIVQRDIEVRREVLGIRGNGPMANEDRIRNELAAFEALHEDLWKFVQLTQELEGLPPLDGNDHLRRESALLVSINQRICDYMHVIAPKVQRESNGLVDRMKAAAWNWLVKKAGVAPQEDKAQVPLPSSIVSLNNSMEILGMLYETQAAAFETIGLICAEGFEKRGLPTNRLFFLSDFGKDSEDARIRAVRNYQLAQVCYSSALQQVKKRETDLKTYLDQTLTPQQEATLRQKCAANNLDRWDVLDDFNPEIGRLAQARRDSSVAFNGCLETCAAVIPLLKGNTARSAEVVALMELVKELSQVNADLYEPSVPKPKPKSAPAEPVAPEPDAPVDPEIAYGAPQERPQLSTNVARGGQVPDQIQEWRLTADRLISGGDLQGALKCLEQILKLAPGDRNTLFQMTQVYRGLGQLFDAVRCCGELLQQDPRNQIAYGLQGDLQLECAFKSNNNPQHREHFMNAAYHHYGQAINLDVNSAEAHRIRGMLAQYFPPVQPVQAPPVVEPVRQQAWQEQIPLQPRVPQYGAQPVAAQRYEPVYPTVGNQDAPPPYHEY